MKKKLVRLINFESFCLHWISTLFTTNKTQMNKKNVSHHSTAFILRNVDMEKKLSEYITERFTEKTTNTNRLKSQMPPATVSTHKLFSNASNTNWKKVKTRNSVDAKNIFYWLIRIELLWRSCDGSKAGQSTT